MSSKLSQQETTESSTGNRRSRRPDHPQPYGGLHISVSQGEDQPETDECSRFKGFRIALDRPTRITILFLRLLLSTLLTRGPSSTPSSLATQHLRSARPDEALDRSIPKHWDCFLEENTTRAIPLAAERFDRSKLEHWNSLI
ncbi:unnamed protein product [Calypogeia fissa]